MIISAIACLAIIGASTTPPKETQVSLKTQELTNVELDNDFPLLGPQITITALDSDLIPFRLPKDFEPDGKAEIPVGAKSIVVRTQTSDDMKSIARIWVDWNDNKIAEPSEFATPVRPNKHFEKGKIYAFPEQDHSAHVRFLSSRTSDLTVVYTACAQANVTLGDYKVQLRILDSNFDVLYTLDNERGMDAVNTRIQKKGEKRWAGIELVSNSYLSLPDNAYYWMTVSPDGKHLILSPDKNSTGSIQFKDIEVERLDLSDGKNMIHPTVKNGMARVPVGEYQITAINQRIKGSNGKTYLFIGNSLPDYPTKVKSGEVTTLACSRKAQLSLSETTDVFNREFTLSCTTPEGLHLDTLFLQGDKGESYRLNQPVLSMIDSKGVEVFTKEFEIFSWKLYWVRPYDLPNGIYTVKVTWDTGLYGVLTTEKRLDLK